jgi:aspartyl/glutamyl-tRNA(Asn/Gln) amidotransferase C subunit
MLNYTTYPACDYLEDYGKIDRKMLEHICSIAKLNLSDEEYARYQKELQDVIDVFRQMDKVDTQEEPSYHPIEIKDRLRDDEVIAHEWDPLCNSKSFEGRYFKSPKIV